MSSFSLSEIAKQFFALQTNRLFTIATPLTGRSELVLTEFDCDEVLGQLFEIKLKLASQDPNIELKKLIGKPVTVTLQLTDATASSEERYFHGYVTDFEHTGTDGGLAIYEAIARPWIAFMDRRQDIRIFQEQTVEEILDAVLHRYRKFGDVEFRLHKPTANRSYCTQYKETDLTFGLRLMQEEGLFFYFEHAKDAHKLIIGDTSVDAQPIPGRSAALRYSTDEILDDEQVITSFAARRQLTSGSTTLKTVDYKAPGARRQAQDDTGINQGDVENYEVYDYLGAHGFADSERGEQLARFRTEALAAHSKIFVGKSYCRRLTLDRYIQIEDHYDHERSQPEDRQFLLTSIRHHGTNNYQAQPGVATYSNEFKCIRKKIPYRPLRMIAHPVIHGIQTAIVVGPQGQEIYTDELGRVKVQFHWDRLGKRNHASSCWVRVSQPWASGGFGMIQLPRIGDEVVIVFGDGNPDRPLIISSVYNAQNMPPWQLPANATQSGILTRSTKGGSSDTANALRFEDRKGQEEVWLHAEKDQRIEVENDESHSVGNDRDKSIGNDESAKIGRNWTLSTGGVKFETVGLASVQSVGLGKMLNVGLAYNVNVGGLYLRNVVLEMATTVGLSRVDRVVQDWTSHVGHTYAVTVRGKAVGDAVKRDRETPLDISPDFSPQIPDPVQSSDSNQIRITDQGQASLSGASTAQLIGPGGTITIDAAGIHLKGKGIYLDGPVTQSGGSARGLAPVTEADCAECAKKTQSAHPVDVATGQKLLTHDDFTLPGRVPIQWNRRYRSADQRNGSFGVAWKLQYATEVHTHTSPDGTRKVIYVDFDGRQLHFPFLEAGQEHFHPLEKYTLARLEDRANQPAYEVRFSNGLVETYEPHPVDPNRHLLQRSETRDGQALTFSYTSTGSLQEVRNNVHVVACKHDDHGRIVEVHLLDEHGDSKGKLATYQYDDEGNLSKAVNRGGQTWRYGYANHLLTSYETPAGAVFVSEWDGDTPYARCVRTHAYTLGDGGKHDITRDTRFDYLPAAQITRVTDAAGQTTTYRYNGLWAVDQITHPDGSTEYLEFDETGNVSGRIDPLGRRSQIISDSRGNPIAIRDAAGHLTRIEYSEHNLPTRITDPAGQIWQREYDANGHLVKAIDPLGNATSTAYEKGLPVAHTDELGNVAHTLWNDAGQLLARTDCSRFKTQYAYDDFGRQTSTTNALGQTTKVLGNAAGNTTAIEPAGLGCWRTAYDKAGRPTAYTDPLGRVTSVGWDAYDRPLSITDAMGGSYRFEYDQRGKLTALTNPKGERGTFAYDQLGRIIEQTGFDGRRQQFRFNAAGELIEQIDCGNDGQLRATLIYDNLGQIIGRQLSDNTQSTFSYDERGLLKQAYHHQEASDVSQITYEYDAAGRRTAEVQAHHGRVWRLQHRLDAVGNRSDTHLPGVGNLTWQRYGSGHIHGMLLDGAPLASFERDALHRTVTNVQGAIAQLFAYTDSGQLASQQLQDLDSQGQPRAEARPWRAWDYDAAGQLTDLHDAWRGAKHYSYDPLSRLLGVARERGEVIPNVTNESFRYDSTGNLIARLTASNYPSAPVVESAQRAIGDRLHQFVTSEASAQTLVDFNYDGHGNRTARTAQPISDKPAVKPASGILERLLPRHNASELSETTLPPHVTRYRYDAAHQLIGVEHVDGGRTEYRYDALGRRIAKIHTSAGQSSRMTLFVWDNDWMLQEVHTGKSTRDDALVTYVPHPDHRGPLAQLTNGKRYHYLSDHLGAPQELVDDEREVVWAVDLDGYGRNGQQIVAKIDNPIRFPGQYHDAESGLYYNRHRYYDPEAGRYINQDPLGLLAGPNKYTYADSRPSMAIDPIGLMSIPAGAEMGAVAGTALLPGIGTIIGAAVGTLAGIGLFVWMASSASSDKAGNKVSSIADTIQPPGNCSPGEHRRLQDEVNRACKRPRACKANMDQPTVLQMRENNRECAMARDLINKKCFAGGDANHRNEALEAWANVAKCEGLLK
ncbi:type VI secretion system tip protein TssI/VgrG [Burkholderia lata]|uniref:ImpA family type VI secretion-associated protein n=1 Tax=Burkholderia lata (strain ATCC 17760 / DSM 23089 / LMG 22485 / NCIMB 9086 / R18194 / 383) TaxID=482957 RepID=A0A6P3A525_BURL3|nr:type VI secretion system tip protein TssI/VgrG [Burkholderia lata]VWD38885.1 ImpA family type VI secretion-associated protein [Burkholderia lata]